jgi:hypothetical protein
VNLLDFMTKDKEDFLAMAERWAPAFKFKTTTVVAFRHQDALHLRQARIHFSAQEPPALRSPVSTASMLAEQEVEVLDAATSLRAVREAVEDPTRVSICGKPSAVTPSGVPDRLNFYFERPLRSGTFAHRPIPKLIVHPDLTNWPQLVLLPELCMELLAHDPPFETLHAVSPRWRSLKGCVTYFGIPGLRLSWRRPLSSISGRVLPAVTPSFWSVPE